MAENYSYQDPDVDVGGAGVDGLPLQGVVLGQKLMIYAIILGILGNVLGMAVHPSLVVIKYFSWVISIVGVIKLGAGFRYSGLLKCGCVLFMFLPFINLVAMLVLSGRATKVLRANGYKVGLLGASGA